MNNEALSCTKEYSQNPKKKIPGGGLEPLTLDRKMDDAQGYEHEDSDKVFFLPIQHIINAMKGASVKDANFMH